MPTVKIMPPSGVGGLIQGQFGTYQPASDGAYTVDVRDAPGLMAKGFNYVLSMAAIGTGQIPAPAAAAVGHFVASAACSNGALSIANQPDVVRPAQVVIGTGTTAITAGQVNITYTGNDGQPQTDVVSAVMAASTSVTTYLSKGVAHITTVTVSGMAGGTSPYVRVDSTADLSVVVPLGSIDFSVFKANTDAGDDTLPTLLTSVLGSFTPHTAPNGTHTHSFGYVYTVPVS